MRSIPFLVDFMTATLMSIITFTRDAKGEVNEKINERKKTKTWTEKKKK